MIENNLSSVEALQLIQSAQQLLRPLCSAPSGWFVKFGILGRAATWD